MNLHEMSKDELWEQVEALEIKVAKNASVETLINAIKSALGQGEDAPAKKAGSNEVEIYFSEDPNDNQPVYIGVNCKSYRFRRGEWVRCPRFILDTINNCYRQIMDPKTGAWKKVHSYPFQVREIA